MEDFTRGEKDWCDWNYKNSKKDFNEYVCKKMIYHIKEEYLFKGADKIISDFIIKNKIKYVDMVVFLEDVEDYFEHLNSWNISPDDIEDAMSEAFESTKFRRDNKHYYN